MYAQLIAHRKHGSGLSAPLYDPHDGDRQHGDLSVDRKG